MLNKRKKLFIQHYTDRGTNTYSNATQSAISAGYSPRTASSIGSRLLRDVNIKEGIAKTEADKQKAYDLTKDDAIREARENYLLSTKDTMKKYWNDIYLKLKGWDITKIESHAKIEDITQEESDKLSEYIRTIRDRLN
jgi:phage terminase small subunit